MNSNLLNAAVSSIVESGKARTKAESTGASMSKAITALYADVNGNEADFIEAFGNGENPKSKTFKAGALAEQVKAKLPKDKTLHKAILDCLKSRLSEARKLRKLGGMPGAEESIQQAIKRYNKPAEKPAKPEGNSTSWAIPESASMDEIADQLSMWVAKHGAASAGLVKKLADFLPVSVKQTRKAA